MFGKGSKLYSVAHRKCPRCHEGTFFESYFYDLPHVGDVKEKCDHCGLEFEKEPGFFYGAMYVAYALAVATFVTLWVSMSLFFPFLSTGWQIGVVLTSIVVLSPALFGLSKIIWANMFIAYEGENVERQKG
ncbi:MAG: DUF983 domain-containing protein [Bacteroidota bacterium]|jgi:uncharacterized protein (DUF983 family)